MIQEPEIIFTAWCPWADRRSLRTQTPHGGVYLWARFTEGAPDSPPWPELPQELVYVGETKNLNDRPLGRHNRLSRYKKLFETSSCDHLYLSIFRVFETDTDSQRTLRAFTQYFEGLVDWQYTMQYGRRPAMHFKSGTPEDPFASANTK